MSAGRSLRLFLVDGSPSGLLTVEAMNRASHVLIKAGMQEGPDAHA